LGGGPILYLVKGIAVGFVIAAPVGPVGLLCIRRALSDGRVAAFVAGLGAAVADTFYGAVAGLGLSLVSDFLLGYRVALSVVGGLFLLVLGWRAWRNPPVVGDGPAEHLGLIRDFTTTLAITLTNPATILAFMAVFASLGAARLAGDVVDAGLLIAGVFIGSALWWLSLSALASAVRHKFTERWLGHLNQASGGLLVLSGLAVLGSLIVDL
jgi:threonine/homoserine/homoserine lactone efflux protein